jgi:excisionase family DNA binding protein
VTAAMAVDRVWMPVKEAAKIAQVSQRTIYVWITEERMTSTIAPGRTRGVLVDVEEVLALAEFRKDGRLPRKDTAG